MIAARDAHTPPWMDSGEFRTALESLHPAAIRPGADAVASVHGHAHSLSISCFQAASPHSWSHTQV